jgi:hypothetical protein
MKKLDRRTLIGAGTAAAASLITPAALAQEAQKGSPNKPHSSRGVVETMQLPGLAGGEKRPSRTKRWYAAAFPDLSALVHYVNTPPAQGAGEVVIVGVQPSGSVSALIYF